MIRHTQACINKWSMEIQICTCGAAAANRQLADKDKEIARLIKDLADTRKQDHQ